MGIGFTSVLRERGGWRRGALLGTTALVTLGLALAPSPLQANDWTGANSTDWFDAGNWSGGVPGNASTAFIDVGSPTPVVGSAGAKADEVYVGNYDIGTLTIQNGGKLTSTYNFIGTTAGSNGTVTVDGAGSVWRTAVGLWVGQVGTGALTIRNGGAVSSVFSFVGEGPGSSGTVTVDGAGSDWTNTNLYLGASGTGALIIQNGGKVSAAGVLGQLAGSTGTAIVDGAGSSLFSYVGIYVGEAGTGTLTVQNGGTVSNLSDNSYIGYASGSTGKVTIDGAGSSWNNGGNLRVGYDGIGTLAIQNGGAVSTALGDVGSKAGSTGAVTVDGAGSLWSATTLTVGGSGTGTLTIRNDGGVTAQAVSLGDSNGAAGTLNVGSASGQAAVAPGRLDTPSVAFGSGTGTIVFNHTASNYVFDPIISGGGSVSVEAGTTILSGVNTYTGATAVNGGTLAVNGSIAASLTTVSRGAVLGGTGIVGDTTIMNGGALAPGNSIGTLTVQGNLTFNAGGFYTVEVSPTGSDRTNVTGIATLTGATVKAIVAGSFRPQTHTILNATGGFGGTQFAGVNVVGSAAPAGNPQLTYDANNVFLVTDPGTIELPAGAGGNQGSVAGSINNAVQKGATPLTEFDALLNMTGTQLTGALAQASGQPGASTAQTGIGAAGQFMGAVGDGAFGDGGQGGQGGALGYAQAPAVSREAKEAYAAVTPRDRAVGFEQRWNVWASVYGGNSRVGGDSDAGTSTTISRTYGALAGASYRFTRDTQAGFALGGAGSRFDIDGGLGGGKSDIFNMALYGRHNIGSAYVAALLGYSWQDTTTDRTVTISGVDRLHASFKAQSLSARLEGGWRFATPLLGIAPYAALQSTTFFMPSYGETVTSGSSAFALSYASKTSTATRGEFGARFDKAMLVQGGVFTLKGRAAWAHDWNTDRDATATFQSLPGATFTTSGAQPSANAALLSLGGEMGWHNGWTLAANFDGEFSRTTTAYSGKGTIKYAW